MISYESAAGCSGTLAMVCKSLRRSPHALQPYALCARSVALCVDPGARPPMIAYSSVPSYLYSSLLKRSSYRSIAKPWLSGMVHTSLSVVDLEPAEPGSSSVRAKGWSGLSPVGVKASGDHSGESPRELVALTRSVYVWPGSTSAAASLPPLPRLA